MGFSVERWKVDNPNILFSQSHVSLFYKSVTVRYFLGDHMLLRGLLKAEREQLFSIVIPFSLSLPHTPYRYTSITERNSSGPRQYQGKEAVFECVFVCV